MRNSKIILIVAACLALVVPAVSGGKWTSYTSADGSFSIAFPAAPKVLNTKKAIEGRSIPIETTVYGEGWNAFVTMRFDFSSMGDFTGREDVGFKFGMSALASAKGCKILSASKFLINGTPGMQVVITRSGVEMQGYFMIRRSQLIVVCFGSKPGETNTPDSRKFVASFKLH